MAIYARFAEGKKKKRKREKDAFFNRKSKPISSELYMCFGALIKIEETLVH